MIAGPWRYPRTGPLLEIGQLIQTRWNSTVTRVLFWLGQWSGSVKQTRPGVELTLLAKVRLFLIQSKTLHNMFFVPDIFLFFSWSDWLWVPGCAIKWVIIWGSDSVPKHKALYMWRWISFGWLFRENMPGQWNLERNQYHMHRLKQFLFQKNDTWIWYFPCECRSTLLACSSLNRQMFSSSLFFSHRLRKALYTKEW